jgi:hypothetical protein
VGLEIEFEYDDGQDGSWSAEAEAPPARDWLSWGRSSGSSAGNPLIVHLGIALAAFALGAASMAGYLSGRSGVADRSIAVLHLAPVDSFTMRALPAPQPQSPDQALDTPWANTFDQDVTLSLINDGAAPVTILGAGLSSLEFDVTQLVPASSAPTAPGGVSTLRGRAHVVCGDFAPGRTATVAKVRAQTADGVTRQETLMVDRFSEIAEVAVCDRAPTPQIVRSTTFSPAPAIPPNQTHPPSNPTTYVAQVTATNRAPFPLRMSLPETAVQSWADGAGLALSAAGDTIIPPSSTGTIAISVSVTDCPTAQAAASGGYDYDLLTFSDARDAVGAPYVRPFIQNAPITDLSAIMNYCLQKNTGPGGIR